MQSRIRFVLASVLMSGTALSSVAFAQDAAPAARGGGLEEIVVTAQRREENVQSVPLAITALSAAQLAEHNVTQIGDLASTTPNVTFGTTAQGVQASPPAIRGIVNNDIQLTGEPTTAVYIDGVYQSTAHGTMAMLGPDVERIEVLRGPQGTLFGRNTIGGALSITTKKPTDEWEGRVMLGGGNYGLMEGQAMVNIPLAPGLAAARFNVGYRSDDGFVREKNFGYKLGQSTSFVARGQLLLTPSESFRVLIEGDYLKSSSDSSLQQLLYLTPPGIPGTAPFAYTIYAIANGLNPLDPATYSSAAYAQVWGSLQACGAGPTPNFTPRCFGALPTTLGPSNTGVFSPLQSSDPYSYYKDYGGSVTASLDLTDSIQLKSITGLRHFVNVTRRDYAPATPVLLFGYNAPSATTFTQELQLNGSILDNRLKFALGGLYYRFKGHELGVTSIFPTLQGDFASVYISNHLLNRSVGVYGQVTYALTDRWNVTAGVRYNDERKQNSNTQLSSVSVALGSVACGIPIPNAACVNVTKLHYTDVDYAFGTDYKVTDDVMIYARVAKGFQAGGINQRSATGVPYLPFDPTTAVNYEVGFKAELLDRHLRMNVSAFRVDLTGIQRTIAFSYEDPVTHVKTPLVPTLNAASGRVQGIEAEATVVPVENLRIGFSLGYTDPKYNKFVDATGLDLSKTDWQQISKWTWGISPSYTIPTSFGKVVASADYFYRSSFNMMPSLSSPTEAVLPIPGLVQPGFGLLNARLAINIGEDTEIAIWGKNLTDKRYFNAALNEAAAPGFVNANLGNPRTYGVQISHNF